MTEEKVKRKKKPPPKKAIRRTAWVPTREQIETCHQLGFDGLFDYQIAQYLGIHITTFMKWRNSKELPYSELFEGIKRGRQEKQRKVLDLLYENANGRTDCKTVAGESYEFDKFDTTAAIFLVNRHDQEEERKVKIEVGMLEAKRKKMEIKKIKIETELLEKQKRDLQGTPQGQTIKEHIFRLVRPDDITPTQPTT